MNQARVLMLDRRNEASREMIFLLRLRGCEVTVVHDGHEMLNWFFSQESGETPFDALVVNYYQRIEEVEELCRTLKQRDVSAPVLLVGRVEHLPGDIEQLGCRVCDPRDLAASLTGFLDKGHAFQ